MSRARLLCRFYMLFLRAKSTSHVAFRSAEVLKYHGEDRSYFSVVLSSVHVSV